MKFLIFNLLAQRQKPDGGVWIQFIIISVIVGIGLLKKIIGGVKKAIEEQQGNKGEYEQPEEASKRHYETAEQGYKTLEQLREEKIAQIRSTFGFPEPPRQIEPREINIEEPMEIKQVEKPVYVPRPKKKFIPQPGMYASKVVDEKKPTPSDKPRGVGQTAYDQLFSSHQDLRKAILYEEILGKPLALRD